jgi:hypothetical protein
VTSSFAVAPGATKLIEYGGKRLLVINTLGPRQLLIRAITTMGHGVKKCMCIRQ